MLFQLAHANEADDGTGYTVKHVFVRASSLLHAHVFVTFFGYRISPEYYDDNDELAEPDERHIENALQEYSLERFEQTNEECSCGEHFWHALKPAASNGLPVDLGGTIIFKVTIQFNIPCKEQNQEDSYGFNLYKMEMNSDIYQFQANNSTDVLQHLRQNSDKFGLTDFFRELPDELNWQTIEKITEERRKCINSNHIHEVFVGLKCDQLSLPLPLIDSNM